jgi:hypothetical protein
VGIQGSFFAFSDDVTGGETTIALDDFATAPTTVCASGVASAVPDGDSYDTHWGGGIGLNLGDPGQMQALVPWSAGSVTGFSFTLTGTTIPGSLRFQAVTPAEVTYCLNTVPSGANSVSLTSLAQECYNTATPGPAWTASTSLATLQWQVATVLDATTPFDFCIENLTAIAAP